MELTLDLMLNHLTAKPKLLTEGEEKKKESYQLNSQRIVKIDEPLAITIKLWGQLVLNEGEGSQRNTQRFPNS